MTVKEIEQELIKRYGSAEGHRVYQTIVPGILADFLKMYTKAALGSMVKETYVLEDGRGQIRLSALKTREPALINVEM
ncbi:MAG: hypothetical protein J6N77_04675 [Lachnospiraceae bacterium]|nr:hypothetical protein [Lachnospiraceae bacterium]